MFSCREIVASSWPMVSKNTINNNPGGGDGRHRPEWIRPAEVRHYFGVGRSRTYEILATGAVKTVSLRQRGQKHGTRLISYDSFAAYLESFAEGGAQ
jgi:hypothetical protein